METNRKLSRAEVIFCEIAIKSFLLGFIFFLYIGLVWWAGHRNVFENLLGFSAIFLCVIMVFVPVRNKAFNKMALASFVLSAVFLIMDYNW